VDDHPRAMETADRQQLDRVVRLVQDVLGPDVVGAYLLGSATLGGLRPESDLDVLVVAARRTTRDEKRRLVDRLLEISGRSAPGARCRRLELTIAVEREIRPWRYPPTIDFLYGDWLRGQFACGALDPLPSTTSPDLASLVTMALMADTPLLGPPPSEVLDPVPHEDLVQAIVGDIDSLLENLDTDTGNVVLTLARIWMTVATGVVGSKEAAADWALPRIPAAHRPVLARARAIYVGEEPERWDDLRPGVPPHAAQVVAAIRSSPGRL
jgi:streptomycin 3"-adenylyltransferase